MKKLLIILCAALCLAIGLTGCANASGGSGSDENYRAEFGIISDVTYNSALSVLNTPLSYAELYTLRNSLFASTTSGYESQNGGSSSDVGELLNGIGLSGNEISLAFQTLEERGNLLFLCTTISNEKAWLYITK